MDKHPRQSGGPGLGTQLAVVLLAAASGAVDAISFTALGHVFAGVMTGNLALLSMALGRAGVSDVASALVALAGFGSGLAATARAGRGRAPGGTRWPRHVVCCLLGEALLLAVGAGVWAGCGGHPGHGLREVLMCGAAVAMGVQSGAMGAAGPNANPSTYLTGTLTTFVLRGVGGASPAWDRWVPPRLAGLGAGAVTAVLLERAAPVWAGVLPPVLVAAATVTACLPPEAGDALEGR